MGLAVCMFEPCSNCNAPIACAAFIFARCHCFVYGRATAELIENRDIFIAEILFFFRNTVSDDLDTQYSVGLYLLSILTYQTEYFCRNR